MMFDWLIAVVCVCSEEHGGTLSWGEETLITAGHYLREWYGFDWTNAELKTAKQRLYAQRFRHKWASYL